jgi:hypothetical protein
VLLLFVVRIIETGAMISLLRASGKSGCKDAFISMGLSLGLSGKINSGVAR